MWGLRLFCRGWGLVFAPSPNRVGGVKPANPLDGAKAPKSVGCANPANPVDGAKPANPVDGAKSANSFKLLSVITLQNSPNPPPILAIAKKHRF